LCNDYNTAGCPCQGVRTRIKKILALPHNTAVQLNPGGGVTLFCLDKLSEPVSLERLRRQVTQLLPRVDLPEILLDINVRTGFASEFTHLSESGARPIHPAFSLIPD
jgi:hypothetical protein